ncbi:MAG: ComF family protein [bacterium]|nr:ComF family protein [bacterium]
MIFKEFLAFLFNRYCACCGKGLSFSEQTVCSLCLDSIETFEEIITCSKCGKPVRDYTPSADNYICGICSRKRFHYSELYVFGPYKGKLKDLLITYKFRNRSDLSEIFAELLMLDERFLDFISDGELFIPVPLSDKRLNFRGYNQVYLILKHLKFRLHGLKIEERVIKRVRETEFQKNLKITARRANIRGAFHVTSEETVKGKNIVLFDDIYTTGATAGEISRILKRAGARKIKVAVIAR